MTFGRSGNILGFIASLAKANRFQGDTMVFKPMIWVSSAANSLIYVSPAWSDLTGQSKAEADGLGWIAPIHPDDRETARATYIMARAALQPYTTNFRLMTKSRTYICLSATATPTTLPDNTFLGYYGAIRRLAVDASDFVGSGQLDAIRSPFDILEDEPLDVVEALADQLLLARSAVADPTLTTILDMALLEVGHRLAQPFGGIDITPKKKLS